MKKKYLYIVAVIAISCLSLISCNKDDDDIPTDLISATQQGTFTDVRDGNTYRWVRYGNLEWMADNFRYVINDQTKCLLYIKPDGKTNVDPEKYGRLYTYKGAEEACPEGWRLPTDEDWKNLEMIMGMSQSEANQQDWRGNIAKRMLTMSETKTDINVLLAGYYFPHMIMGMTGFRFISEKGYYWTATNDSGKGTDFYYFREFMFNNNGVRRQSTTSDYFMSVKYVRDAQ